MQRYNSYFWFVVTYKNLKTTNIKIYIYSILFCMFGFAYGQNYPVSHISFEQNNYNSVTKTIIRSYNGYAVSYIEDGGQHFFTNTTIQDPQNPTNNMYIKKLR